MLADKIQDLWDEEKRNYVLGEDVQLWLRATEDSEDDIEAALKKVRKHVPVIPYLCIQPVLYSWIPNAYAICMR